MRALKYAGTIRGLIVFALIGFAGLPLRAAATPEWSWRDQGPGVAYYRDSNPRLPLVVHVVRIDRAAKDLQFHTTLGGNDRIGMGILSDQVTFIPRSAGKAVAAINGDYYHNRRPYIGDPRNLQILRGGEVVSSPGEDRAFFYLDAEGEPYVTNVTDKFTVTLPNGRAIPVAINGMPERNNRAMLLTRAAGTFTRLPGFELVLTPTGDGPGLPLRIGQTLKVKVQEVNPGGFSRIPTNSMVLSLPPNSADQYASISKGQEMKISMTTSPDISGATLAIGGGPTLVRGGKARGSREFPGFQMRNPRTAFGWNDRYYYFVQADGRQPRRSMGMTLPELANYFVKLECESALNLDGGGSCETWLAGIVVSDPSEGRERPSANALVLVRKPPTGTLTTRAD